MESLASLLHLMPETFWMIVKVLIVFLGPLTLAALLTWAERRGSAMIQDRIGPNRALLFGRWRLLGLPQLVADGIKFFLKEDLVPADASPMLFWLAPVMASCRRCSASPSSPSAAASSRPATPTT
jgi:NADH-quinone oxidoreductase subunit H